MQRRVLCRALAQLRCTAANVLDAAAVSINALDASAVRMQQVAGSQPSAALSAHPARWMPASRPFAAGPASSEDAKDANGAAGGDSGGQAAAAAPDEETDDDESEAARAAMSEAFENLIGAAFEMVQQGKPMEAEYVLSEGAKQAAEILGDDAVELSALYDQLALITFLHERMPEAEEAAQRALQIVQKHDEGFGPPSAIAATRLASTLLANGKPQEAQLYTARSSSTLERALQTLSGMQPAGEEEDQEFLELKEKFEIGLGEARSYHALARQAQNLAAPADVGQFLEELQQGLELMARHLGRDNPLVAAPLREHSRLIMAALEEGKLEVAEALYGQDAQLHMAVGGRAEDVALLMYQCGTLQYVLGKYEEAAESLRISLEAMHTHHPDAEGHLLTVQQRLGMAEALMGRFDAAKERLHGVDAPLQEALGEGNPVSEELRFTLALVALREMEADGVSDPARRRECLATMEKHLKALSAYGDDHMLVKKAAELHAEASGAAPAGGGSG